MRRRLFCATLGWVDQAPIGNRIRWTYVPEPSPLPPLPGGANANDVIWRFPAGHGTFIGPRAVIVERAIISPNEKPSENNLLPDELKPIPDSWWISSGDFPLRSRVPYTEMSLGRPAQAIWFTYIGPAARCVVRSSAKDVVSDLNVENGQVVVSYGADVSTIAVYARDVTLRNLRVLDLGAARSLTFEPIAYVAIAAGLEAPLDVVATRLGFHIPAEATDPVTWWNSMRHWCAGQFAPGETDDPSLPQPYDRAAASRAARFWVALLSGGALVDGPGSAHSSVGGDRWLAHALTHPTWTAYRVVEDGDEDLGSNIAICPPFNAAPLRPPRSLDPRDVQMRYATERDIYTISATLDWTPADDSLTGTLLEEEIREAGSRREIAKTTIDCRHPCRKDGTSSTPRQIDIPRHDVVIRWRAGSIDAWDRKSVMTSWTMDIVPKLIHRPAGPSFASARYNGEIALLKPDAPLWTADRCVRETGGKVVILRQIANPLEVPVTVGDAALVSGDQYRIPISGSADLTLFSGGCLLAGGVWPIIDSDSFEITIMAPSDGTGTARLPSPGPGTLRQSPTGLPSYPPLFTPLYTRVATLSPDDITAATILITDPGAPPGALMRYRAAVEVLDQIGALGTEVTALAPCPVDPSPSFSADVHVQLAPIPDGGRLAISARDSDFYGRTLVVVTLDIPDTSGTTFTVLAAAGDVGSTKAPTGPFIRGVVGGQLPADGLVLFELIPLPLPLQLGTPIWVGVESQRTDGRLSERGVVSASLVD